ncbi:type I restriction-modification system subunit M [uncultured Prevotella sp.]|uniref:type I restriction-modification system subunit M n=1 Tax=uncultured Prevotella sp. TaxID=159272 RepID=UPI0027E24D33|nr:type I restriction-modification system subunit M [uncultured Prevotella sp.]
MNKQQLANKIWASANKMRSKIDANEYKDYILGLIFYKFLSDNEVNYILKDMKGAPDEDKQAALESLVENYEDENSKVVIDYCKNNIGYFIEYKNLFSTWLLPGSSFTVADLSVALNSFDRLVSPNYKAVYDGIFKTLQAGLSKLGENPASQTRALKDLIKLIKDIPTDGSQDYDVLGYVYEYLIGNFAANAGKKAGEFYTPHEVAILMSDIVAEHHKSKSQIEIYDPTSGSGSLLITIGKSIGRHIADKNRVKYYAQELKENTYNLTRMNLVMRGIQPSNINTRCADSLDEDWPIINTGSEIGQPLYVDAVVSNPPYSQQWDPKDRENDARFKDYGVAPKSKADYAFLLHELHHLKPDGILTIVLPHGVLFRGGEEEQIRTNLIEKNNIDAIIGLPANIFFGTGIPTLVMVLKQHRASDDVLIIDASKGFVKDGKQNKLRACDIKKIADTVRDRKDVPGFSRRVSREEIRQNGYNLNIPRYVDSSEAAEQYDIYATMFGGIPNAEIDALQKYWEAFPTLRSDLFKPELDKPYSALKVDDVKTAIEQNTDVKWFNTMFAEAFNGFDDLLHQKLIDNVKHVRELQAQDEIASDMFSRLCNIPLVDRYAVYQALADNWQAIISDIETIQEEGFDAVRVVETAYKLVKKGDEDVEVPDGLKGRIIPFSLVQNMKFQTELNAISALQSRVEAISGELDEVRDSFNEEELETYCDSEKDNAFDKKKITADAKPKADVEAETKAKLKQIVSLWNEQTTSNKQIKTDKLALEEKTIKAIENLTDEEAAVLLHHKWIDPICEGIDNTLRSVLSALESEALALSEKYATSYKQINDDMVAANEELAGLVEQLTGDEFAIRGLKELVKE